MLSLCPSDAGEGQRSRHYHSDKPELSLRFNLHSIIGFVGIALKNAAFSEDS
jgi:hypothetical protein